MELLRNLSIRWKVIHMIMFTMTVALLAACAAFMTYDYVAFRDLQIEDSQTLADMLGTGSTAALSFDDADAERKTLLSLATKSDITQARVYAADGREFAAYRRPGVAASHGRCAAGRLRDVRHHGPYRRVQTHHPQRRASRHDSSRVRSLAAARARPPLQRNCRDGPGRLDRHRVCGRLDPAGVHLSPDSAARRGRENGHDRKVVRDPGRAQQQG